MQVFALTCQSASRAKLSIAQFLLYSMPSAILTAGFVRAAAGLICLILIECCQCLPRGNGRLVFWGPLWVRGLSTSPRQACSIPTSTTFDAIRVMQSQLVIPLLGR